LYSASRQYKPLTRSRDHFCHMGSHSVTCHPSEVILPTLPLAFTSTHFTVPEGGRLSRPVLSLWYVDRIASTGSCSAKCELLSRRDATWSVCLCVDTGDLQKRLNRSRFRLGREQTRVFPRNRVGATWRIRLNDPCLAAMRAVVTMTVASCFESSYSVSCLL